MDFLLMDIKKFLRKLENGQMEIEAGQWELHKDIESMNAAVCELMALKNDVEKITINNAEQMGLIKELQIRVGALDHIALGSESCVYTDKTYKRLKSNQSPKKRKFTKEIDENSELSSTGSNEQTVTCNDETQYANSLNEDEDIFPSTSAQKEIDANIVIPTKGQQTCQYTKRTMNNEILERYLKDSAKYMSRKISGCSKNSPGTSDQNIFLKVEDSKSRCTPVWARPEPNYILETKSVVEEVLPNKYHGSKCHKQLKYKSDLLKHGKRHRRLSTLAGHCRTCGKGFGNRDRLKEHEAIHQIAVAPRNFKGFRCSYCDKISSTPEKLTAHLRQCRIIKKTYRNNC